MTLSFYQRSKSETSKNKIGAQAHQLTTLLDAGFPVPKGFLVSAETCKAFFVHGRLQDKIKMLLERCNFHDPSDLMRVSKNIKKLILSAEIPYEAANSLLEAAVKLSNERVMLTASPLGTEHGKHHHTTRIYGVEGEANILLHIRELWASQFDSDDLYYIYSTEEHEFPCMAICVQMQPKALVSGVLYTTDGTNKRTCMIQAIWGEGGYHHKLQGADTYWIDKESGNENETSRTMQTTEFTWTQGELESTPVPSTRQKKQKLSSGTLKSLASLAKDVQQKLFYPQEVVFAYDGKNVYLIDTHSSSAPTHVVEHTPTPQAKRVLLKGVGATPGIITGKIQVVKGPHDKGHQMGGIVVAKSLSHIAQDLLRSAQGIILEEDTPTSVFMDLSQKGIALLTSAAGAVDLLEPGSFVTLHTPRGEVLAGGYTTQTPIHEERTAPTQTATRIGTQISLGTPTHLVPGSLRGHLILSPQSLIRDVGIHPLKLVAEHKSRMVSDKLAHSLTTMCTQFPHESLLYTFSHFTSDEYARLHGGERYESLDERNPLMGYLGATRIVQNPELLTPEVDALVQVRKEIYGKRLSLLLPPARTAYEIRQLEEHLAAKGLARNASCRHYINLSIPSLLWELDGVSSLVDGVVFNLDMIYAYLFAHDPTSDSIRLHAVDREAPLLAILDTARHICHAQGIALILRGSLLESDQFLSFAVRGGIHELVVPQKITSLVRERLAGLEEEIIGHV